ncbi:MAG: SH3 domain-containing protein [Gemmatimonadota bacterium]
MPDMQNALIIGCVLLVACGSDARTADGVAGDSVAVQPTQHAGAPAVPGLPKLLPVDQADASFAAFRAEVLAALQRKDTSYLYALLAPEIKIGFGGGDSIAGFRRLWQPSDPESQVWDALTRALSLGGKMTDTTFNFPYVFAFWPDSIDAFEHVAITGSNVTVHEDADEQAPVIATLSHDIVPVENWQKLGERGVPTRDTWAQIKLPGDRTAYVNGLNAYSPVSWRGFFTKRGGRWLLVFFVAGD